ncbi:Uncharacterised protein [Enterococcus mundtii]|nr:Uncharacterised protein [Enterococcus mundtii]
MMLNSEISIRLKLKYLNTLKLTLTLIECILLLAINHLETLKKILLILLTKKSSFP